ISSRARRARVPLVYTEHDATPWMCRYRHWHERMIRRLIYCAVNGAAFRRSDMVVTLFRSLALEIRSRWGLSPQRVTWIRNGTDVDIFKPVPAGTASVRNRLGIDRYFLFVGQLTSRKSPDLLLRAISRLEDATCVVVGAGPM